MLEKDQFQNPASVYRSAPFWALNDKLETNELKRQIKVFKEQGIGGVFLHPRGGLATEYLSEEFMNAINDCIEQLEELDMVSWLYDEDRFPSGVAGGRVLKENPEFSQKCMVPSILHPEKVTASDSTLGLYIICNKGYKRINACEIMDEVKVLGEVKVLAVTLVQKPKVPLNNFESYVDVCNKEAIDCFIRLTHEKYYSKFKNRFGKNIQAIFTDEPGFYPGNHNGLPWTKNFFDKFISSKNYNLLDKLPELFLDLGDYRKTRFDYWDLIASLFVEAFSKNIYQWCQEKGIAYTGHFWEHVFPLPFFCGSVMPHYEYMQIPGIDMLFVGDPDRNDMYGNDLNVKEVSSVANQLGRKRVLSETHGGSGWGLDFRYQKRVTDWQLALGINLFSQHLSMYSMTGYRKRDYPLSFLDHQPWWDNYKMLGNYMGRTCYALSQGKYQTDVLILHPSTSTWTAYGALEEEKELQEIEHSIKTLVKNVNQIQVMFDLGDDVILSRHANIVKNVFCVGEMKYKVIILPKMNIMRGKVFNLLKEFYINDGIIITTDETPVLLDGVESSELVQFFNGPSIIKTLNDKAKLSEILYPMPVERIRLHERNGKDLSNVYAHVRLEDSKKTVFICNLDMTEKVDLNFFVDKPYFIEKFNFETGEINPCDLYTDDLYTDDNYQYYIKFTLAALNSCLFLIHEDLSAIYKKENAALETYKRETYKRIKISPADWLVKTLDKNAINLQFCIASLNNSPLSELYDVLEINDKFKKQLGLEAGNIFMRQPYMYTEDEKNKTALIKAEYPFHINEIPKGELMVASELPHIFTLFVNDTEAKPSNKFYKDRAFVLYDIKPYVKTGENTIRLESDRYGVLVNLESVYIVGDFKLTETADGYTIAEVTGILPGNLVEQGYPYYSGLVSYTTEINAGKKEAGKKTILEFENFEGVTAVVKVNGEYVKTIGWKPYRADITEFLKKGKNAVTIEIANSLQNLMGPFGKDSNQNFVTPRSFYTKKHVSFLPVGFSGEAAILVET